MNSPPPISAMLPPWTPAIRLITIVTSIAYILEILWIHWLAPSALPEVGSAGMLAISVALRALHLGLVPEEVLSGQIWQVFTYMLLHDPVGPFHLILNMGFLWLFGAELEMRWGSRRFLFFYLITGGIAGLVVILWSVAFPGEWGKITLGASASFYALVAAHAVLFPRRRLWPIPITTKTFAWVLVALAVLFFLVRSEASFAAHMGGLLAGWLVTTGNWRPRRWLDRLYIWQLRRRRGRLVVVEGGEKAGGDGKNGKILH